MTKKKEEPKSFDAAPIASSKTAEKLPCYAKIINYEI
jgi:hypothetical protein